MTKQPISSTEKVLGFLKENKKSKYTAVDIKKTVFKNKKTKKQVDKTMWNLTKRTTRVKCKSTVIDGRYTNLYYC